MDERMGYPPIKYGRAKVSGSETEYVYYREIPGEALEFFHRTEKFWDLAVYGTWFRREKAEHATRLEQIDYAMLPEEARTNETRMTVAMGALNGFKKAQT